MIAIGIACARLALAVVLVAHGAHDLAGMFAGPGVGPGGLDHLTTHLHMIGLEPASWLAIAAGVAQLAGGVLIGIGWFARWAAGANLIYVGAGIWKESSHWGLFINWTGEAGRGHGMEYAIVITGVLLLLMLAGAGDYSIDGRRARHHASRAAGRARLRRS